MPIHVNLASNSYLQMTLDRTQCLGVLTGPKPLPMKSKRAILATCTGISGKPIAVQLKKLVSSNWQREK